MSGARKGPDVEVTTLKPCPFCGGPASMLEYNKGTMAAWHVAGCDRELCIAFCLAQVHRADCESAPETARKWNQRAKAEVTA